MKYLRYKKDMKTNLLKTIMMYANGVRDTKGVSSQESTRRDASISGDSHGCGSVTSGCTYIEHIMGLQSASDRRRRQNRIWKYAAVLLCLLILGVGQAWAGGGSSNKNYYSKVTLSKTGSGKVYCQKDGTSGTWTENGATSAADSQASAPTHTWYIKAVPETGWAFKEWNTFSGWTQNPTAESSETSGTIKAGESVTEAKATATFVKVFQFKAKADFATGSATGKVWVSFENTTPTYQTTAMTATSTQNGTTYDQANATKTAYFNAQAPTGTEFKGWYSDAACTKSVSSSTSVTANITSSVITEPSTPQETYYAKFEKVPTTPSWALSGVAGTSKTLEIGQTIGLVTEASDTPSWGTPTYVDAGETNPVMTYNPSTKTFTANRAGTVTVTFTQAAGEDANGVLWLAGEQTFTFTVNKRTPQFAWADPLPNFVVNTTLPVSNLFSFTPAESEQNWTLTSSDPTNLPSIAAPATTLSLPKEVNGVTLTFHQDATWEWNEIANTSIRINVTKEPVTFNWKNPSLIAGGTYSWTDFVETNSVGAWNLVSEDESVIPTMRSIASTSATVAAGTVTLTFTQGQDLAHDAVPVQTKTFTVYPADGLAQFKVGSTYYTDLNEANSAASSGSNKTIVCTRDGILPPGDYTISSGNTLLIPYNEAGTMVTAEGSFDQMNTTTFTAVSAYRTLTFAKGANLTVNGALYVAGQHLTTTGELKSTSGGPGRPVGPVGRIQMADGGHIELNGKLYCFGFITGQGMADGNNTRNVGTISANSGATVYENFILGDMKGGGTTAAMVEENTYHVFPFNSYFIQNIEVPLTINYGATEKCFTSMNPGDSNTTPVFTLIGTGNDIMFKLNGQGATVTKWYDPTTDHFCVKLSGNSSLANLKITAKIIVTLTIDSKDFICPIPSSMHIILDDCNVALGSDLCLLPGSILEVRDNASMTVNSNMYLYDVDNWGTYCISNYYKVYNTPFTVNLARSQDDISQLDDAKLLIDGAFVVSSSGKLYSTANGANICGNHGGTISFPSSLPGSTNVYQVTGTGGDSSTGISVTYSVVIKSYTVYFSPISAAAANLHNENDTYTKSIANKTFHNIHGRWFVAADKDPKEDHTYSFTYLDNGNTGSDANTPAVYSSSKTELKGGYKWVNVSLDNTFCGSTTYRGIDGHYYYYNSASTDAVSKWVQLVKLSDALYDGSNNNLYTFTTGNCSWVSVGEIDENCMYTVEGVKKALVGTEFVALEKDEYDEVYVNVNNHSDYYMLFSGCVWQHATKIPDTYRAYEVLGNPYIWLNNEWTQVAEEYGYYYTTDDQNIKHYYEFDDVTFSWRPVTNKVRITAGSERRDFITWDIAMLYLSQYTNPTVTLLDDAIATQSVATLAPGSKSTEFTFDLNGHTLTANIGSSVYAIPSTNHACFMNMNTSAKLYITDNSDKANGQMLVYGVGNKNISCLRVTKGNVVMNGGRIYMENGFKYVNNANYKYVRAAGISLAAGQTLEINGGEIEAKTHQYAYGVYGESSASTATTSKITMNGGKVTGIAATYAYGILSYGIINMNDGTVEGRIEEVTSSAGGTTAAGTYAYGIYGHASVSAVDANSYYATINMTGGTVNAKAYSTYAYGVFGYSIYTTANGKKSDGTSDNTYKPTDGTYSNKASCKLNITGGTINAIVERSSNSYGIYSAGTFNSYKDNKTITPHVIKNVKVFSQATSEAYGILMTAQTHEYSGGLLWGEAIITNADVYAETTVSTGAYAVCASATNIWTNRARYLQASADNKKTWYVQANDNDGDVTHEGIAATSKQVYQYQIGCHVAAAKVTINSGTYRAKSANSTSAYGAYCSRSVCPGDPTGNTAGMAELTINGGTFSAETMTDTGYGISNGGITTVNGGTINVHTGTTTAYGVYGWAGTLTLNSGVEINSTADVNTAYGVAANGWISTSLGLHTHGNVIVNEGVTVNVTTPNSTTAYGAYALATSSELNQTKYDARSANDKKQYYAVNEEGTTVTNATVANYYPYRFGTYVEGGEITINGGTFNVKTFGSTAIGAGASLSNLVRTTELGRVKVGRGVLNVYGGTFNVESETSSTAEGIRSYGLTHVYDGTFNVQTKTTTAYGVCARDGETIIDGGTFNVTAGTNTAVGASAWADDYNTDYGYYYTGDLTVNGGTFNVKTWNGEAAYGVQVRGTTKNFKAAKVVINGVADAAKDYAIAGTATINGGTFIMTPSNGTKAYSTHVYTTQTLGTATATPTCYVKGGFFQTNGTTTSGMYVSALKENNVVTGGHFSDNTGLTSTTVTKNYVNAPYAVINCIHPEYKATYPYEVTEAYTITFKDDEGNTLWSGLQPKGSVAVYPLTNGIPEKTATATNSFEFAAWDTPLATVTADATYTATFNAVAKKFMVTWKDDEGNEIDHMEYASGSTPAHADPVKEGYTFTGWTPAITAVGATDQVYTASFTIKQYTIRFVDEDGTELKVQTVNHGTKPTAPANPTKDGYSFSAWNPGIVAATEPVTYTATYLLNIASVTTSAGKTTNYTAWSSALTAANKAENSTLKLLTDVGGLVAAQATTQTFTLDLNGHTLSGAVNKLINVNAAGKTLTIRDSQDGGMIATKSATSQLVAVYVTKGTLNIEGGHIRAENTYTGTSTSYYGCGVLVSSGYACNMSRGTVEGITNIDVAYGLYNNGGTVTITGGTINAEAQTKAYGVHVKGNTTVSDAAVTATTTRTTIADAFYVTAADKTLTINSGVFTATTGTTAGYAIEATAAATVNVNGGKFKSTTKTVSNTGSATIKLNAGFYDTDTELAGFASPKQVVGLTTEPEKAEGYNYKIVDNAHQITFKNEDGSIVLQQSKIEDGIQPVYHGEAQTKKSTPKYSYTFDGWMDASDSHVYADAELPTVSKDAVYTAHFAQQGVPYPITFANIDGLGTNHVQMVTYGEVPVYNGPTPYMSGAVSNYAYTFIGWDPELAAVDGPATYTPRYNLVISHNVSFVINNASATTPTTLTVAEGAAVERPADQLIGCQHIAGWYKDAALTEVWDFANDKLGENDLILYAKWETKTYTITWLDETGEEIDQTTVDCGTVPSHADLYKTPNATFSYEWKGWNKTLVAANADATYKSLGFTQVPKRYAITFVTGTGATVINPIELEVGATVVAPADPIREGYTFNGWIPAVPSVMPANDVECVAQWTINIASVTVSGSTTYYETVEDAITFANGKTDAVVTILQDAAVTSEVAITAAMTIDLNGKTVSSTLATATGVFKINASGKIVTINGAGTINHTAAAGVYGIYAGSGTLNMTDVTVIADGSTSVRGIYVRGASGSTATVTLTDVTVEARTSAANNIAVYTYAYTDVTINSGTYTTTTGTGTRYAVYARSETGSKITIKGGKFNGTDKDVYKGGVNATISISGGYYVHQNNIGDYCVANHYVFDLPFSETPYKYEVAEGYTLTFDANGYGTAPDAQVVKKGGKASEPTAPTAEGYTFGGWYKEETCTNAWIFSTDVVTAATELYAKWTLSEKGAYLDIVDWTSTNEVVLNMNGYTSATAKANWVIRANGNRYTKTQRDDTSVNAGDRTMKIDLTGMGLSADQKVVIEGLGTEDVVESYHSYTVPHIYNNSATLSGTNESSIVYVRNTATLTINANTTIKDIYVNPGAELKINEGATLTVTGKIVLRTEPFASAVLTNNGTLTIADGAQMYYSRKQADNSQIYQLALPYETDLSNAVLSNGKEPSVSVMEYNSADRAEYGKSGEDGNGNWQKITGTALQANKGYQLLTPSAYYYEVLFPIAYTKHDDGQTVSVTAYSGAAGETSKGWNYICSPYTAVFECNYTSPEQNITISQLSSDNKTFTQDVATTIKPAQPFYYQATAYGYLEFSQTNFVKKTKGRYASNSQETQWIRLRATNDTQSIENLEYIEDNSELSDIANLYINNKFSKDYELGYDVEKMSTTGSKPLIYTSLECGDLALAALPDSIAQEAIPVSLYMPQNGNVLLAIEYTDFMNRLSKLWLVDNLAGEKTDLLTDNYLLFAEQGTTKGRLFLQAEFIEETPEVTTDDNNIKNEGISIYNIGHTIVVENSAEDIFCFDATGKLVTHKKPDEKVMLNVPQNGMYLIQVGKETKKIVIE